MGIKNKPNASEDHLKDNEQKPQGNECEELSDKIGDIFDKDNAKLRPILGTIEETAEEFVPFEERLEERYWELDNLVYNSDLSEMEAETSSGIGFVDLLMGRLDNDLLSYHNPLMLFYQINQDLLETYEIILGKDTEDLDSIYTDEYIENHSDALVDAGVQLFRDRLAHPKLLKQLDVYKRFIESTVRARPSLKDVRDNALEELEALQAAAKNYHDAVNTLIGHFSSAKEFGEEVYECITEHFDHIKEVHMVEGQKIVKSLSLTSIARFIYDNMFGIDDIDDEIKSKNISSHKINKAARLLSYVTSPETYPYVKDINNVVKYAEKEMERLYTDFKAMLPISMAFKKECSKRMRNTAYKANKNRDKVDDIKDISIKIHEVNFNNIKYQHPKKRPSKRELRDSKRADEAYEYIIDSLDELSKIKTKRMRTRAAKKVVGRILEIREEQKKKKTDENTYYRCTDVDGEIMIEPCDPPMMKIDKIKGKNYDKVVEQVDAIKTMQKYRAVAETISARGRLRDHIMMIGPPGCGKTELMRAIGSDPDSIAVEVRGADFGTKWAHETEKNPKRLFEQAEQLYKKTGKRVNMLLDEAETLLAKTSGHNASTHNQVIAEFNAILDGTTAYEGVNLIVALNTIKGIKDSMMRRYHVYVVGELDDSNRAVLLEDFVNRGLPINSRIIPEDYYRLGTLMEGAIGDIMRKPVDMIEKSFLQQMEKKHPQVLKNLNDYLTDENGEFDLANVTSRQRIYIKEKFSEHGYVVTPSLLQRAVENVMADDSNLKLLKAAQDVYREANRKVKEIGGQTLSLKGGI